MVMAAFASFPSDGVLCELLEDDRVARRAVELRQTADEEIACRASLGEHVWALCAMAQASKSDVIGAAHVSVAFMHFRVFDQAGKGAWALFKGGLEGNIEQLRCSPAPGGPTLLEIWKLLQARYSTQAIIAGLGLLRGSIWSSTGVEQQHGSASTIMNTHATIGEESMMARAFIHAHRQFFQPVLQEQALEPHRKQVDQLRKKAKQVNRKIATFTCRSYLIGDHMATLAAATPCGRCGRRPS